MNQMIKVLHTENLDFRRIKEIYTDGGLMFSNPSDKGGAWAWVGVDEERRIMIAKCDIVLVNGGQITNNTTETMAIVKALEAMPNGWSGTIISDSEVALTRLFGTPRFHGCPPNVRDRLHKAVNRLGKLEKIHVSGHPSIRDLNGENGYCPKSGLPLGRKRDKDGNLLPVSKWNKYADELCKTVMAEHSENKVEIVKA
jgi:ribonuclease HI